MIVARQQDVEVAVVVHVRRGNTVRRAMPDADGRWRNQSKQSFAVVPQDVYVTAAIGCNHVDVTVAVEIRVRRTLPAGRRRQGTGFDRCKTKSAIVPVHFVAFLRRIARSLIVRHTEQVQVAVAVHVEREHTARGPDAVGGNARLARHIREIAATVVAEHVVHRGIL